MSVYLPNTDGLYSAVRVNLLQRLDYIVAAVALSSDVCISCLVSEKIKFGIVQKLII